MAGLVAVVVAVAVVAAAVAAEVVVDLAGPPVVERPVAGPAGLPVAGPAAAAWRRFGLVGR